MTYFGLTGSKSELRRDFDIYMVNSLGSQYHWVDCFPVDEQILADYDGPSALLVDVGGGKGHDLSTFHKEYSGHGKLVLQDLAEALENVGDLDPAIERMVYDLFTGQPVASALMFRTLSCVLIYPGALTFVLNHFLHDWSDEMCLKILKQVRKGMRPGYSKLLIHETIVPKKGAPPSNVTSAFVMLIINSGMERTEQKFRNLLDKAGFKITGLWPPTEEHSDGIIEAVLGA